MRLHVMINAYWEPLEFEIPPLGTEHEPWRRCIDTSLESPDDIRGWADARSVNAPVYSVEARSVVILIAHAPDADSASNAIVQRQIP